MYHTFGVLSLALGLYQGVTPVMGHPSVSPTAWTSELLNAMLECGDVHTLHCFPRLLDETAASLASRDAISKLELLISVGGTATCLVAAS